MKPLEISVALCTFNGRRFIEEQLVSVIRQSRRPAEIVVADDGSSDDTLHVVQQVVHREDPDGTIAIIVLPPIGRLGVAANFSRAVARCSRDIIALCDQDDVWHTDKLEVLGSRLDQDPDLILVHSDADLIDEHGRAVGSTLFRALEVSESDLQAVRAGRAFPVLLRRNLATGATVLFRRDLLEVALPVPGAWVHDEWFAIVAAAVGRIGVERRSLIDYRQHTLNQIGVAVPSLRRKIARVLAPRGERNVDLFERAVALEQRLTSISGVPGSHSRMAKEKLEVERTRSLMPASRVMRIPTVVRLALSGGYRRYCSRRDAEIFRDLLQPAGKRAVR